MTTRQGFGQKVWYDVEEKGYVMLDVTDEIEIPDEQTIDGIELLPKQEFHCSLVAARRITSSPEDEAKVVEAVRRFLSRQAVRFIGLTADRYVCRKNDEMTVIARAEIEGLPQLRDEIAQLLPDYQPPFPHVTLLKSANSSYGIGVNSEQDLTELCIRLK